MPEIKYNFLQGKMNKDLDERLVPNGQYRDALNIKISTSDNDDIGTAQNIKGNTLIDSNLPASSVVVGSIADEKNNSLYCPFGTILSSRSLFILPRVKVFLISGIY